MPPASSPYEPPRRHPAHRARVVAGATSAAAALGIAGYLAAAQGVTGPGSVDATAPVEAAAPGPIEGAAAATTTPSTTVSRAPATTTTLPAAASAARPLTPARRRITTSRGS